MKTLASIIAVLGAIVAFILPALNRKNEELKKEVNSQNNQINNLKENVKIIKETSNVDIISGSAKLRERKRGSGK